MGEVTRIEDGFVVGIAAAQLHSTPGFRPEIIPNNYNLSLGFWKTSFKLFCLGNFMMPESIFSIYCPFKVTRQ